MGVDKAYFVRGDAVAVYDVEDADQVVETRTLSELWAGFTGPMDAALDLGTSVLYVFSGTDYYRIPFGTQAVDDEYPRPTSAWSSFASVDAAMNWGDGKVYLFSGSQYIRYDIADDVQDPGYPKDVVAGWSGVDSGWLGDGIDAAVNPGNGHAYLFKGDTYVTIDWHSKKQIAGPAPIVADWHGLDGPVDAGWTNAPPRPPAGPSATAAAFWSQYHAYAEESETETGVPWLVTLGQAALESGWGSAAPGNNFFGIKAKATDLPESRQLLRTTEVLSRPDAVFPEVISVTPRPDGRYDYVVRDWFRSYATPAEGFAHHGRFLRDNARYAAAFEHTDDPYEFARQVAAAGYATAPTYADVLVSTMQQIEASAD